MTDPIIVDRQDQCLLVKLNRPENLNSFTIEMHRQLLEALKAAESDKTLRSLVLTGVGRAFCAGQDLQETLPPDSPITDLGDHLDRFYNPLVCALRRLSIPVIAAVNGVAAGAGASLAFASDIIVAGRSARFVLSFSRIGLVPDSGATWFLPRQIGPHRALAFAMLGEPLDAATALDWGLVWKVFDDEAVLEAAMGIAKKLATMPPTGLALTKKAHQAAMLNSMEEQLDVERNLQSIAGATPEYRDSVQAFLEKRAPTTSN